uniref:CCHC-type domain-containing protein n=1 Tax=Wuchereria bancrofti TaxID=6293 RepID=A0AAF5RVJ0_WUCBA
MAKSLRTNGRALWIEEFIEDDICHQDYQHFSMNLCVEKLGCLNCNSDNHETTDCILPSRFIFKRENGEYPRKMVLLKLRCNTISNPRHMLPYDYPVKGTVLHVDRKENCLYVRPQNLDGIYSALENFLFDIRQVMLCTATSNKINIGDVYLIRRQDSDVLARGVCAHMYFNWQMATQWQMYLIDIGQTEFVDQRSIYLLPAQLHSMPPMAIPLVLANCRIGYESLVSCNMDHFSMLNIGQSLSLSKDGYYPSFVNSPYPLPLLARVFGGISVRDEIFCKWGLPEISSLNQPVCPLYCPSTFSFNRFTLGYSLPVTLTVRVTEKITQSYYWLRDASACSIISKQIVIPSNGLWPYIEDKRSLACIAHIQRSVHKQSHYYRAVASNFDNQKSCCMVFLIDYGQTLYCDVHHLFDLSDQPPAVLYTLAAAFKCNVNRKNLIEDGIHAAKLAMDEQYIIQVTGKEDETTYVANVDMHIQTDFQYPIPSDVSNGMLVNNSQFLMLGYNDQISQINEISDNNIDINNIDYNGNDNKSMKIRTMFPAISMQLSSNREIGNSLKALDTKFSIKLAQISNRIDELFNNLRSLQLANSTSNLFPFPQMYQYSKAQGVSNNGIRQSQTSSFPVGSGKDIVFYGTNCQSSLLGQTPLPRCQTVMYPQQYIQQKPNIVVPSGRNYFHCIENHRCTLVNHPSQSYHQPHTYTNHINQQVQPHAVDYTQQFQLPRPRVMVPGCTISSQQRDLENQTSRSCCFCGAYMETKRRSFTSSNDVSIRCSTVPHLNATHLQSFTYTSANGFRRASTAPVNCSSTIHSLCKNSNTPSNADSQLSSRSISSDDGEFTNYESIESKKLRDKKVIGVRKKQTVIEDSLTTGIGTMRRNWRVKETKEFEAMNNSQGFQFSNRNNAEGQLSPPFFEKSAEPPRTICFTKEELEMLTNRKSNSIFSLVEDALCFNVNSQVSNNSDNVALSETSRETQDQNMAQSCWICGKVGHLTRYCQSTLPTVLVLAQEVKEENQKKAIDKPRDEKGRVLYTSDESSNDELDYDSDSDKDVKQVINSSSLDQDIKLLSDDDEKDEFEITLKYKPYFAHMNVEFGQKYVVSRSDEDIACLLWPLFFVQIQSDECEQILEEYLDSLDANIPLANTEMVVGTLCVAYCERFDAKFRAVIMAICSNLAEVFYIDYGNYEWVEHNTLSSIADKDKTTIAHPGMAIPCILNSYDEKEISSRLSQSDIIKMKLAVGCGQRGFHLNFRKRRPDGVCVVELEDEAKMD